MTPITLRTVAARLKRQKETKEGSTVLFLGAGASISAGVPSANGIMHKLETEEFYCDLIATSDGKSYANYMRCLAPNDRKRLIDGYITEAKINPAHLYAAHLIAEGYIDCVVTTNFDPLILRALALYNTFPAVYDLTTMRDRVTNAFDFPAVLFLHGQSHGFWQMNTEEEMREPVEAIHQAFVKISQNRSWLVVGYSGTDPVFNQLAAIDKFGDGLYWAGYHDEPESHVREQLLNKPNKGVWFLPNQDADNLFRELNALLKLGDPPFIKTPFTHMLNTLTSILPAKGDGKEVDLTASARQRLTQAVELFEKGNLDATIPTKEEFDLQALIDRLDSAYNNQEYQEAIELEAGARASGDPKAIDALVWVFIGWGDQLSNQANAKGDDDLFRQSYERYAKSVEIKPDKHEAWYNWGTALSDQANAKGDDDLYRQSYEKYARALEIKPDKHEAWYNWGTALYAQAKAKGDDDLYRQSYEKYAKAVEIKPDMHEAWYNWGSALSGQARASGDDDLFRQSYEKYAKAVQIKPDLHEAWNNWGSALSDQAMASGDDDLFRQSYEKYAKTVEIKPDMHEAWNNWGNALLRAWYLTPEPRQLTDAIEKYKRAESVKKGASAFNLACAYSLMGDLDEAMKWLLSAYESNGDRMLDLLDDRDLNNIRELPEFKALMEKKHK